MKCEYCDLSVYLNYDINKPFLYLSRMLKGDKNLNFVMKNKNVYMKMSEGFYNMLVDILGDKSEFEKCKY